MADAADPSEVTARDSIAGRYTLLSVRGQYLPFSEVHPISGTRADYLSGYMVVYPDGTCETSVTLRIHAPPSSAPRAYGRRCGYTLNGSDFDVKFFEPRMTHTGTWTGRTLEYSDNGSWVYFR